MFLVNDGKEGIHVAVGRTFAQYRLLNYYLEKNTQLSVVCLLMFWLMRHHKVTLEHRLFFSVSSFLVCKWLVLPEWWFSSKIPCWDCRYCSKIFASSLGSYFTTKSEGKLNTSVNVLFSFSVNKLLNICKCVFFVVVWRH